MSKKQYLIEVRIIKYLFDDGTHHYSVQVDNLNSSVVMGQYKSYAQANKIAKKFKFKKPTRKNMEVRDLTKLRTLEKMAA
jgi:hypothetical protein